LLIGRRAKREDTLAKLKWLFAGAVALAVLFLPFYRIMKERQQAEMDKLYRSAFLGRNESLLQLASYRGSYADSLFKSLLFDDQSLADSTAATRVLLHRGVLHSSDLGQMLTLQSHRQLRHAAYEVFRQDGCDVTCMRAALLEIQGLWSGTRLPEETPTFQPPPNAPEEAIQQWHEMLGKYRGVTEKEALALVDSRPCEALVELKTSTDITEQLRERLMKQEALEEHCAEMSR
jgi:hypothetical protein